MAAAFQDPSLVVAQPLLDLTPEQVAEQQYYSYLPLQQQGFEPSPGQPLFAPDYTFTAGQDFQELPQKRVKSEPRSRASPYGYSPNRKRPMDASNGANARAAAEAAMAAVNKPKRVRTGCLTCRERHLKCDEGMPTCMNCRKSARECKRGIRLNFIDTTCKRPPTIPMSQDWRINFVDESRDIAREYIDGEEQYSRKDTHLTDVDHSMNTFGYQPAQSNAPMMSQQAMPNMQALHGGDHSMSGQNVNMFAHQEQQQAQQQAQQHAQQQQHQQQHQQQQQQSQGMNSGASAFSHASLPTHHSHHSSQQPSPYHQQMRDVKTEPEYQAEAKEILNTQEETLYMQVFVEEVGLWMDSMDSMKHVSVAQLPLLSLMRR